MSDAKPSQPCTQPGVSHFVAGAELRRALLVGELSGVLDFVCSCCEVGKK